MKPTVCITLGTVGAYFTYLIGGWNDAIITLFIFMICDYILGLLRSSVFHIAKKKSDPEGLNSDTAIKGLLKKFMCFVAIIVMNRVDVQLGTTYFKDATCIAFMTSELISIVENLGLMGVYIPAPVKKAIAVLQSKNDEEGNDP